MEDIVKMVREAALNPGRARAIESIRVERARQVAKWGDMHDDDHEDGALADAAAIMAAEAPSVGRYIHENGGPAWPADLRHKHRGDRRHQLVIAGALVLAEIERLDRRAARALEETRRRAVDRSV